MRPLLHSLSTLFAGGLLAAATLAARPAAAQHDLRFTSADDDQVTVTTTGVSNGPFTYEIWVKYSAATYLGSYNTLIELGGDQRTLYVRADSTIELYGGTASVQTTAAHKVTPQQWHHVACTYDDVAAEAKLYLDGALVQTVLTSFPNTTDDELGIGHHSGDTGWQGELDEVVIWSSVRTAAQIQVDRTSVVPLTSPTLVAYYKFNGGSGQTLVNQKAGGPAGVLGTTSAVETSDPVWTTTNAPVAVPAELAAAAPLTLHPNPAPTGTAAGLTYTLPTPAIATLTVEDALGRRVATLADGIRQSAGEHTLTLNTAGLRTGLYLCRLSTESGTLTRRLVVE